MSDFISVGNTELVPSEWGCPNCGERIVGELIIDFQDDDTVHPVHCSQCGAVYTIATDPEEDE